MRRVALVGWAGVAVAGSALAAYHILNARAATDPVSVARAPSPPDDIPAPPEADERTKEMRRFDRYDRDKDGRVVPLEFLATRQKAFAKLDLNHDGQLSFEEYAAKARAKFAKADKDKSEALDRAEFAATKSVRKLRPSVKCPPDDHATKEAGAELSEG